MESDRLEKLAESVEILKERHLSLKAERDVFLKQAEVLAQAEEKIRVLKAERKLLRKKVDGLIKSIDSLANGDRS
ncbi:MAG: hypothetical protein IMF07_01335 [Proteobacteria bacterium]|nr:hypothetical protein [Pseudomonadota bacterium]